MSIIKCSNQRAKIRKIKFSKDKYQNKMSKFRNCWSTKNLKCKHLSQISKKRLILMDNLEIGTISKIIVKY